MITSQFWCNLFETLINNESIKNNPRTMIGIKSSVETWAFTKAKIQLDVLLKEQKKAKVVGN